MLTSFVSVFLLHIHFRQKQRSGNRNTLAAENAKREKEEEQNTDDWKIKFYNTLIISPRFHVPSHSRAVFLL
jgi:hypothetical protein